MNSLYRMSAFPQLIVLFLFITTVTQAGNSPLNVVGLGMENNSRNAREQALGSAGLASVGDRSSSYFNPSRSAFNKSTGFLAVFETEMDYLQDNRTSNRLTSTAIPMLALDFQLGFLGKLGAEYYQRFDHHFEYSSLEKKVFPQPKVQSEGGAFEIVGYWAYAPIRRLALAVAFHRVLGQERSIYDLNFNENPPIPDLEFGSNFSDTTIIRREAWYPAFSMTYRQRDFSVGSFFQASADLETKTRRGLQSVSTEDLPSEQMKLPWKAGLGGEYKLKQNQMLVLDLVWKAWDKTEFFVNPSLEIGMGYEFNGTGGAYDPYYSRLSYRGGANFTQLAYQEIPQYQGSIGLGLPLGKSDKMLDLAFVYGHRGDLETYGFSEDYLKMVFSVTGISHWGKSRRSR